MPKYYVHSGNLKFVCEEDAEPVAALMAFDQCIKPGEDIMLSSIVCINEEGFDSRPHDTDVFLPTSIVLDMLGIGYSQ